MLSAVTMACEQFIVRGAMKGQPATGTDAGYMRHRRAGETPCRDCQAARVAKLRDWNANHPGADTARKRQWRLDNPERTRETDTRWRENNRESLRENSRRYAERHPDRVKEAQRRWYEGNPDLARARRQAYYKANAAELAERQRAARLKDPEAAREKNRRWRRLNSDRARLQAVAQGARRRAAVREAIIAGFSIADLEARLSMFSGCWMCGAEATEIDHVKPLAVGGPHCLANLRPACTPCNRSKGAKWPLPL